MSSTGGQHAMKQASTTLTGSHWELRTKLDNEYNRGREAGLEVRRAEVQQLHETVRRRGRTIRRLNSRRRAHAYINRIGGAGRLLDEYEWEATIMRGARWYDAEQFPTHAEALAWALEQLKEEQ